VCDYDQQQRLVELGVDEAEIKQSGKDKFKRTHTGFCPKRDDWDEVKPLVMLVALRIKFKVCGSSTPHRHQGAALPSSAAAYVAPQQEMQPFREYMDNLIKSGQDVFFVEHTRNDRCAPVLDLLLTLMLPTALMGFPPD
jgi:hypothetical protein